MQDNLNGQVHRSATPWNRGKLIGPKPPLKAKEIWSIRVRLQVAHRTRDLALFNLALDSKLRACDLVGLRVDDVALNGRCEPEPLYYSGRPAALCSSRSRNRPARPSDGGLRRKACIRASRCSRAGSIGRGR